MSAITMRRLDELRQDAAIRRTVEVLTYQDALHVAPRLVVVGHLLRVARHLLVLAIRVARRGVMEYHLVDPSRR